MWKKTAATAAATLILAGCAAPPTMTRDEYLRVTQHTYPDKTPEQVFAAAEKLFRLADGNDFKFSWSDDALYASRQWSIYLVLAASFGVDNWIVQTKPTPEGTKVRVAISTNASAATPMMTTGGDFTATGLPSAGAMASMQGTAIYDVFWARLDYLLGLRQHWMTCDEANDRVKQKITWGVNDPLCNSFNLKDDNPEVAATSK